MKTQVSDTSIPQIPKILIKTQVSDISMLAEWAAACFYESHQHISMLADWAAACFYESRAPTPVMAYIYIYIYMYMLRLRYLDAFFWAPYKSNDI